MGDYAMVISSLDRQQLALIKRAIHVTISSPTDRFVDCIGPVSLAETPRMMTRRQLLGIATGAGAAITVGMLPGLSGIRGGAKAPGSVRRIKISPVPGVSYSKATLAFMHRARFETPRHAIYGMKDPNIPFLIQHVPS